MHPQSIVHSLVQFEDGSMKAQMGLPDMKLPIQYAFTYPNRLKTDFPRFNFMDYPQLTFEKPDMETFNNLQLAFDAMNEGGSKACSLNAANEVAVAAFLNEEISFLDIARINGQTMHSMASISNPELEDYITVDAEARVIARKLCEQ